jgi:vitamin B12 transporter
LDEGELFPGWLVHDDTENKLSSGFLQLSQPLAPRLHLDLNGYLTDSEHRTEWNDLIGGKIVPYRHLREREKTRGADARLTAGDSRHNLVVGAEYLHVESALDQVVPTYAPWSDNEWDQFGTYANGTFSFGRLTILPGIRYDHTGIAGDTTSYTLGATWQLTEKTLLRAYGARGYSLPTVFWSELMTVKTVQVGFESTDVPCLWLKGTYFHNWLRDIQSAGVTTKTDQDRRGFELEVRTVPLYGFSLAGGYTYTHVEDADTGERLETNGQQAVPPHLLKLALNYDHAALGLRGTLTGNYVDWNAEKGYPAQSRGLVWDLHLAWKVLPGDERSPELFFSGRNLFNNVQTTYDDLFRNAPRWFEGGLRFTF